MAKNSDFTLYNEIIKYDRYARKYVANNILNIYRDLRIYLLDEVLNKLNGVDIDVKFGNK